MLECGVHYLMGLDAHTAASLDASFLLLRETICDLWVLLVALKQFGLTCYKLNGVLSKSLTNALKQFGLSCYNLNGVLSKSPMNSGIFNVTYILPTTNSTAKMFRDPSSSFPYSEYRRHYRCNM